MEITSKWIEKYRFSVTDGRHEHFILDVPPNYGGEDKGPTALELAIMALATCLGTSYKLVADKMHLDITSLEVKAIANKTENDKTVTDIHLYVKIESDSPQEKLQNCLELAEENCPVDQIFLQTQIPMEVILQINE
ncbi:MAG: OsmC family protein [Asgard group archaeon]|nr:OsmC family protein [Asgard group archaeon]